MILGIDCQTGSGLHFVQIPQVTADAYRAWLRGTGLVHSRTIPVV
jgi:hypothetical protein